MSTSPLTIRNALPTDALALVNLLPDLGYTATLEQMAQRLELILPCANHAIFVAEDTNLMFGWCHAYGVLALQTNSYAEIGAIVVSTKRQGEGIGSLLIRQAEEWAMRRGYKQVRLRSSTHREKAHRFYEQLGYFKTRTSYSFERNLVSSSDWP